nr:MAG: coat protein [Totiviridae sp.]
MAASGGDKSSMWAKLPAAFRHVPPHQMASGGYGNMAMDEDDVVSEADSALSWAQASDASGARVSTSSTLGLRRICTCKDETEIRALYLRRSKQPQALKRWQSKHRWTADVLKKVRATVPDHDVVLHETFKAAWAYTIAKAVERLDAKGLQPTSALDPAVGQALGSELEFTDVKIPFPIPESLQACALQFYGQQTLLRQHLFDCVGQQWSSPSEDWPPHLQLLDPEDLERKVEPVPEMPDVLFRAAHGLEDLELQAAGGEEVGDRHSDVASTGSRQSQLSAAAPLFVPKTPPKGYAPDPTSLAGVKKVPPMAGDIVVSDPKARAAALPAFSPIRACKSDSGLTERALAQVPTEPAREGVLRWMGMSPPPAAPRRDLTKALSHVRSPSKASTTSTKGTQTPRAMEGDPKKKKLVKRSEYVEHTPMYSCLPTGELRDLPKTVEPDYPAQFYDEGPTTEDAFRLATGLPAEEEPDTVPCDHSLFTQAMASKAILAPHKYCAHVRRALATVMMRHPTDWGITPDSCRALGALVDAGYIHEVRTSPNDIRLKDVGYVDRKPCRPLQEMYNIEVKNRFQALYSEEMAAAEADFSDLDEYTRHAAKTSFQAGKRQLPSAAKDSVQTQRRQKRDDQLRLTREQQAEVQKTREQKKRDGKYALKRIVDKLSSKKYTAEDIAKTMIINESSPAVRKLLEEQHHWLRSPVEAMQLGKWCWVAACMNNGVDPHITTRGLFCLIGKFCDLTRVAGSTGWVRDLCKDGDVEQNPGPVGVVNPPTTMEELKEGMSYWDYISDQADIMENTLAPSLEYMRTVTNTPYGLSMDANNAVLLNARWYYANQAEPVPYTVPTWSTSLYPTTLRESGVLPVTHTYLAEQDADAQVHRDSVPHTAVPGAEQVVVPLSPAYDPQSPEVQARDAEAAPQAQQDQEVQNEPANQAEDQQQQQAEADGAGAAADDGGEGEENVQEDGPPPAGDDPAQNPPADPQVQQQQEPAQEDLDVTPPRVPTAEERYREHVHSDNPDVIMAGIDDHGLVVCVTSSMGQGVAMPLQGNGIHINMIPRAGRMMRRLVIARYNNGQPRGLASLAFRQPITLVDMGDNVSEVRINGELVKEKDAEYLALLKNDNSPFMVTGTGSKVYLIGEWYPAEGNGCYAQSEFRSWGPPRYAYAAQTGVTEGTPIVATTKGTDEHNQNYTKPVIVPRIELTSFGLDRTTAEKLVLLTKPSPTTCEANALKLGFMCDWVRYGESNGPELAVLTGQAQVHEPRVRISRDTTIKRLFNASGCPNEDCGGLVVPCFPFHRRWRRGRIRFYATAQAVPRGEDYIILPSCFDGRTDFTEAAIFLLSFLPWPWGNMSLGLQTVQEDTQEERWQIFSWHGTATSIPGSLTLNVVVHQVNVGETSGHKPPETELGCKPRMGPTPVEFWPANAPIPINYKAGQHHFVPASAFAASWALGFGMCEFRTVIDKIFLFGLFDDVHRWIQEGVCLARNHAGVMTARPAKLSPEVILPTAGMKTMPVIYDTVPRMDEDGVPLIFKCWAPAGNRIGHVPSDKPWPDIELPADAWITLPDLTSLCCVYSGLWSFGNKMKDLYMPVDHRLLTAAQFLTCERTFVAWHLWHAMNGMDTETMAAASRCVKPGRGEARFFTYVFGYGSGNVPAFGDALRGAIEKFVGGRVLRSVDGVSVYQRMVPPRVWEPQVVALSENRPLPQVCPTPMVDDNVFKYVGGVSKCLKPFRVSYSNEGNPDIYPNETPAMSYGPPGTAGTFIWSETNRFADVDEDDIVDVKDHEVWLNRLVHHFDNYALADVRDGTPAEGAPSAGQAPVTLTRCIDDWAGSAPRLHTEKVPYPFFSTMWSSWMRLENHRRLTLQASVGDTKIWYALLEGPRGVESTGSGYTVVLSPSIPMPYKVQKEKLRMNKVLKVSENLKGGAPLLLKEQTNSGPGSNGGQDPPQGGGSGDPKLEK